MSAKRNEIVERYSENILSRLDKEYDPSQAKFINKEHEELMKKIIENKIKDDKSSDDDDIYKDDNTFKDTFGRDANNFIPDHHINFADFTQLRLNQIKKMIMNQERFKKSSNPDYIMKNENEVRQTIKKIVKDKLNERIDLNKMNKHNSRTIPVGYITEDDDLNGLDQFKKGGLINEKKGKPVPIIAHGGELVVPADIVPKVLKSNDWLDHVKNIQKERKISYKQAMQEAKGTYKK